MTRLRHKFGKRQKYGAKPTEYNGRRYDSKREAAYARELDMRKAAGEVIGWLPQVPIPLPGGVRYVVDFLVFDADGTCRFIDVKGVETPMFKTKIRMVADVHPWLEVEIVK